MGMLDRLRGSRGKVPAIVDEAVEIIVKGFSPVAVIVYGPSAEGYVYQNRVQLVVIVDSGDTNSLWSDMVTALTEHYIDGDVTVFTIEEYLSAVDDSYTVAYKADKTGYIAYERA